VLCRSDSDDVLMLSETESVAGGGGELNANVWRA
jgi:hypothetical protein